MEHNDRVDKCRGNEENNKRNKIDEEYIMKFRKKPVVVEATEWDGTNESWQHIMDMGLTKWNPGVIGMQTFYIETLEGYHLARKGDWIIKGVHGEFYPCKPDVFVKTYEPAE